ncbi:helicase-related protein [Aureibacter tunicatorum]|uniref:Superfamily II DNA or RNA helicase n=1 Tax=Aureibacter tunicatorum TaxID=866807 RepID=A0AAE3XMU0_9BACT|nr:helicase-related protein [Aureibacter tunicatorum]MDR6239478.1 superfamily II DNA or RNA helicase [Aureibacter tunicatorum]BDD04600.1 ATP-dependent helicase [Aureibacter tunicatorum]
MSKRFFTNNKQNSLIDKFQGIFDHQSIHQFDALVGYFRASGYFKLRKYLNKVPEIRILVGINVDELTAEANKKGLKYLENPERTKSEFLKFIKEDIAQASYHNDTESGIIEFIEDIISGKVKIKAHGKRKLHAKIYIFRPNPFNEHTNGNVITGSSNLTDAGLGTHDDSNYEFNVLLTDYEDVKFAGEEFEELWEESVDILPTDIQNLKKKTYLHDEISPNDLYLKMLIEYFGDAVIGKEEGNNILPKGYTNLQYQADAVLDGFDKLLKHNGFILADVVGLGKTVVATRIIKKYIETNGYNTKVLVVYPNALEEGWKMTIKDFELNNYIDFISNGSLHKIIDGDNRQYANPEDYDLIVVDESHKFRSSNSNMYGLLELICKTPRKTVGHDLGRKKKVMLISATPLNNRPEDIANQIYLFQDARKSTLEGVPNLQTFFSKKIEVYKKLDKITDHQKLIDKVKEIYLPIKDKVFSELVIRRTRADIQKIKRYKEDIDAQGMSFPEIKPPKKIEYVFDEDQTALFHDSMLSLIDHIGYFRYRAIEFIDPQYAELYDNANLISRQLSKIMKTQMVKRLESSFFAFKKSLKRFHTSNARMIEMFENDKIYIAPDLDINKLYDEGKEDDIEKKINEINEESPNNAIYKADDFAPEFIEGLHKDQVVLEALLQRWNKVKNDPKTEKFLKAVQSELLNETNLEKKLVIFSESKETVQYLADELKKSGRKDVLAISANNHKQKFNLIRKNFDANYAKKQENDYNIIITTEVLAEGINLHRSNVILNYDIPWNATRLMQRIGRVNRIGTKAKEIYIYNFYPTAQSNELIELNEKALKKLQGFHSAFGEDSKIYSEQEELIENSLGNLDPQEEIDERLHYLEVIRELYNEDIDTYRRIKKIPLKSRVGRLASVKGEEAQRIVGNPIENACLCYLRNNTKEGFYLSNDKNCVELTFVQAVKLFEAEQSEKNHVLTENHFDAVAKAIESFKSVYNFDFVREEYDTSNLSVFERNAILFLKSLIDFKYKMPDLITEELEDLLNASLKLIYMGVFRKFRTEVATYATKQKKKKIPVDRVIKDMIKLMSKYPIKEIARLDKLRAEEETNASKEFEAPKLVLTETFA